VVLVASVGSLVFAACDLEPDTKYGPHSGLSKSNLPVPPAGEGGSGEAGVVCDGGVPDAGACTVSFSKDIWGKMSTTWHCSDASCHGGNSIAPYMLDNASDAYTNLTAYMIGTKPYFNPCSTDPDASAFVCNVSTPSTCGSAQMPFTNPTLGSGPMSTTDLGLVTTWVQCGAPNN